MNKEEILEERARELQEETEKWDELGINLNMMKFTPEEILMLKCQMQAIINCVLQGKTEEIDMNIELKEITMNSMKEIREAIEPQVLEAKREMFRNGLVPKPNVILPPWEHHKEN